MFVFHFMFSFYGSPKTSTQQALRLHGGGPGKPTKKDDKVKMLNSKIEAVAKTPTMDNPLLQKLLEPAETTGNFIMQNIDSNPKAVLEEWLSTKCSTEELVAASEAFKSFKTCHDVTIT